MNATKRKKRSKPQTVNVGNVTVKIYKRTRDKGKPTERVVYEVADYTGGSRRFRGFSDIDEAKKEGLKIAQQISSGNVMAAAMRNGDAASYGRSVELLRATGVPLEIAASVYAKCFEILGGDRMIEAATFYRRHGADQVTRKPVASAACELIAAKEARGKSARYIGDLKSRLSRFAASFGADASTITEPVRPEPDTRNRGVDISTITTADVQRWLDGLKLAPQTAKNFRTVIGTLFSFAESRGYVVKGSNPVDDTEEISANGGDIEVFTPAEIEALLRAASETFRPVIFLGGFAGLRTAEIERIDWKDILDVASEFIHISAEKAKTRSRRLVPILPNLAAWLKQYAGKSGKVWTGTLNDLKDERAAVVKASGVAWKNNGLRHGFISYRLAEIQNAAQVSLEAGNSPKVVFKHYRELVKPAEAKAWFGVMPQAVS